MLIAVKKNKFIVLLITVFGTLSFRIRTGLVVVDDSRADDFSARREDLFEFELSQRARQAADVEIRVFNAFTARTSVRHLQDTAHDQPRRLVTPRAEYRDERVCVFVWP